MRLNYGGYRDLVEVLQKGLPLGESTKRLLDKQLPLLGPLELILILEMRETMTRDEIGKVLFVDKSTIDVFLSTWGGTPPTTPDIRFGRGKRNKFSLSEKDGEQIDFLYHGLGYGTEAIGKALHVAPSTVRSAMKRFGIKVRTKSESSRVAAKHRKTPTYTPEQREAARQRMFKMQAEGKMGKKKEHVGQT